MNPKPEKLTKKELDRRQGLETNLHVRSFDSSHSPEEFSKLTRLPVSIILDNLRSAFNVGSIIRTADCVRAEKVHFCGYTAHPPHLKLEKTALGAMPYVPWAYHESVLDAIHEIKQSGQSVIALETTNKSKELWNFQFPLHCALIFGNEALGVSKPALELVDDIVEIPMMGYKNSINVAVAFGIVTYEIQRQYWHNIELQWREHQIKNQGGNHEQKNGSPHSNNH